MLYKKLEDNNWLIAEKEIILPDGTIIDETNQLDGWKFRETEPLEYTSWKESQNQERENL